jgi:hypothetical protein
MGCFFSLPLTLIKNILIMKKISYVNAVRLVATAVVLIGLIIATLSSCSKQGYGCKGNQSWDKMVRRMNSQ